MYRVGVLALLLVVAGGVWAKDYSDDWKIGFIIQPRYDLVHGKEGRLKWQRVRVWAGGPISDRLAARVTVDRATDILRIIDLYADWEMVRGRVPLSMRVGQFYQTTTPDGTRSPLNYIDFAIPTQNFGIARQITGVQLSTKPLSRLALTAAITNGENKLLTGPNDRPTYLASATWLGKPFKLRAWGMVGFDRARPTYVENPNKTYGIDLYDLNWGRLSTGISWFDGKRYGRTMHGLHADVAYRFDKKTTTAGRLEWFDTNTAVPGSIRQRWTWANKHALTDWLTARADFRYEQGTGHPEAIFRMDFAF